MTIYQGFISRMINHLHNNNFHDLSPEDLWGRRVEYDLVNHEVRILDTEERNASGPISFEHLGNRLYHLHEASTDFMYPKNHPLNLMGRLPEQWIRRTKRIQNIHAQLLKAGINSLFDELFLKNYTYFNQLAQVALFYLEDHHYNEVINELRSYGNLAYRSFSLEDVEIDEAGIKFINPENWVIDLPVRDLANFIKNTSMDTLSLDESVQFLKGYQTKRELLPSEHHLIYAILLYPNKFFRLVETAYSSRREDRDWDEEISWMVQQYQDWEMLLARYRDRIKEEFRIQLTPVEWISV
jgi:spore coat protein YutH